MRISRVARRYAAALFTAALEGGLVPQVQDDLGRVRDIVRASPDLEKALTAPRVPLEAKHRVIDRIFAEAVSPLTLDFLHLCLDKRRPQLMEAVAEHYAALRDEHENIVRARVTTAVELSEELRQRLIQALEKRTGRRVMAEFRVEPDVLGGVLTIIGDTVVDGSLRSDVAQLGQKLRQAPVTLL